MIIGMVNPQTKIAAFQIHVNPLISFIWIGVRILILGALVVDVARRRARGGGRVRLRPRRRVGGDGGDVRIPAGGRLGAGLRCAGSAGPRRAPPADAAPLAAGDAAPADAAP